LRANLPRKRSHKGTLSGRCKIYPLRNVSGPASLDLARALNVAKAREVPLVEARGR